MKELSIEEKAKRYDKAIIKAKDLYGQPLVNNTLLETIFPELAESEDERIRKEMIFYFTEEIPQCSIQEHSDKMRVFISWLKRQEVERTKLELKAGNSYFCYKSRWERADSETFKKGLIYKCNKDGVLDNFVIKNPEQHFIEIKDERIAWLEKQGEKSQGKSASEAANEEKIDNQNCVKPTDNVEPKFHEGDWVVSPNGVYWHIDKISNNRYEVTSNTGESSDWNLDTNIYHRFTIQDAKAGDVLICKGELIYSNGIKYERICLFNNLDNAFFTLTKTSNFVEEYDIDVNIDYPDNTVPATKEQKEIIFMAMKDAGYEFDFEKKELKKIEQKPVRQQCADFYNKNSELQMPRLTAFENELANILFDREYDGSTETEDDIQRGKLDYELAAIRLAPKLQSLINNEQKPAWSEEDEELIKWSVDNLTELKDRFGEEYGKVGDCINFLKSLKDRVQPKPQQEWSDEDEQYLLVCKNALAKYQKTDKWDAHIIFHWLENKLKSLRPQNHWKPSDEQIKVCKEVYADLLSAKGFGLGTVNSELNRLEEQLKKLREE